MKNAMKKLLSLVLVAMLLVSVVPMGAMAAESGGTVYVKIKIDSDENSFEAIPVEIKKGEATVAELLKYKIDIGQYVPVDCEFKHAWTEGMGGARGDMNTVVKVGETIELLYVHTQTEPETDPQPEPTPYSVNVVVKLDGKEKDAFKAEINGETTTVGNLIDYKIGMDLSNYDFTQAWVVGSGDTYLGRDGVVNAGDTVHIAFNKKPTPTEKPTEDVKPITVVVKVDKSDNVVAKPTKVPANGKSSKVGDLLTYVWNADWNNVYEFSHAWVVGSGDERLSINGTVKAGEEVHIMLKRLNDVEEVEMTVKVHFAKNMTKSKTFTVYKGSKIDIGTLLEEEGIIESEYDIYDIYLGKTLVNKNNNVVTVNDNNTYDVYMYDTDDNGDEDLHKSAGDAYLNIYLEENLKKPAKRLVINGSAASDSRVSLDEVKKIVKEYFVAKDSDGIIYDGLYMKEGNWKDKWANDEDKHTVIENVNAMRNDGDVTFIVVIDNAKAKSNNGDPSNPKTGDDIYMTVTVMGLSAAALCAVYFVSKKRAVR